MPQAKVPIPPSRAPLRGPRSLSANCWPCTGCSASVSAALASRCSLACTFTVRKRVAGPRCCGRQLAERGHGPAKPALSGEHLMLLLDAAARPVVVGAG